MDIYVRGMLLPSSEHQSASFEYRGLVISAAQGGIAKGLEVVVFPEVGREFVKKHDIPALMHTHSNIPDAIKTADRIADAIDLGLIEYEE